MSVEEDIRLRLGAQRALLDHVTPNLRSVSVDIDPYHRLILMRFAFQNEPSETAQNATSCVATEIIADYSDEGTVDEQYRVCPVPEPMEHLRLVVYLRCEDEWVSPKA